MTRNDKGIIGWFCISLVIGLIALVPMAIREVWQWQYYGLASFEWDDIQRYGHAIFLGSIFNAMIVLFALTLAGVF